MQPTRCPLKGLVVTGTDTGVGKTCVTLQLFRRARDESLSVGAMKPLATGAARIDGRLIAPDTLEIQQALGAEISLEQITPCVFEAPLAPPAAARLSGGSLQFGDVHDQVRVALRSWADSVNALIVEGIGGFLCPIAADATFADLALAFDFPVAVVARAGLGTLNHTLLTIEAIKCRGLRVAAVFLNDVDGAADISAASNPAELARRLGGVGPIVSLGYNKQPGSVDPALAAIPFDSLFQPARFGLF